jgi:nucleoid DNA-binding protein
MGSFKGFEGIEEYSAVRGDGAPVSVPELDHIINEIVSHTKLTKEQTNRILSILFQEIRFAMLSGKAVNIHGIGSLFISSPKTSKTKIRVFPKFIPSKTLIKKMNYDK